MKKTGDTMDFFKYAFDYLKPCKFLFFLYILENIFLGLGSLLEPVITGDMVNNLTKAQNFSLMLKQLFILALLAFTGIIIQYHNALLYTKLQTKSSYQCSKDLINHIQNISLSSFHSENTSYLCHRINSDTNELLIFIITNSGKLLMNIFMFLWILFVLIQINIPLLLFIIGLSMITIFLYFICKNVLYQKELALKESQSFYFSKLLDHFTYRKFIKMNACSHFFFHRLEDSFHSLYTNVIARQKTFELYESLHLLLDIISQVVLYFYGGLEVIRGNLSIGILLILINYSSALKDCIKYFYSLGSEYQAAKVCYQRLKDIIIVPDEPAGTIVPDSIQSIDLINLSFSYGKTNLFEHINLSLQKGQLCAFVGRNGVGKSTLIDLILGLYQNQYDGSIQINQIPSKQLDWHSIRKTFIGITEQEPVLVADSLLTNLTLGNPMSEKDLIQKLKELNFFFPSSDLKTNLYTKINEKQSNISGGEKQKIAILRLLIKNPPVMIFDEPTSAMDEQGKIAFLNYLNKIKQNKIIILSTHDDYLINNCDKILDFKTYSPHQ